MVADQITASVVRILTPTGAVTGAGFLVSPRHVLTCAHVVAQALDTRDDAPVAPTGDVRLDFPLLAPGQTLAGRVVAWRPVRAEGSPPPDDGEDIAGLELVEAPPEGSRPARLVTVNDLWGETFRAFGFPSAYDDGVWASGVIRAGQAGGWVQIEDDNVVGYVVAPGFSGTLVWGERTEGVVGMVVGADRRADVRAGFIIPTARLIKAWPELAPRAIPPCPYRGLSPFREQDAPFFRGRATYVAQLQEAVHRQPLTALIGPSGSGKSSVVFAGLIPRLRQEGRWAIASFRPGDHPFASLAAALVPLLAPELGEIDRLLETRKLAAAIDAGELPLADVARRIVEKVPDARGLLLVADQFEELYTLCRDADAGQRFLDGLLAATRAGPNPDASALRVVLTMRADFVGRALSHRPFADALQHADLKLGPMNRDELRDAIEAPARLVGVGIEDGLTERILEAVCEGAGDLPLLEFALTRLWSRQVDGELTHDAYDEIGGVERALADYAEDLFRGLDDDARQRAQHVFVQLVRPGQGMADTRRLATRAEVGEENWELVARLASGRLVVSGRDEVTGADTVEIVHEALIQHWQQLRGWIEVDRAFRTWQERLRAALDQWKAMREDEGALLRGALLAEAEGWLRERGADLSQAERAFIEASLALRDRERLRAEEALRQKERDRLRYKMTLLLAIGLIGATLLSALAGVLWFRAEDQRQFRLASLARQLAGLAATRLTDRVDQALLLAVEADRVAATMKGRSDFLYDLAGREEARGRLLYGLITSADLVTFLRGQESPVTAVAFSPDSTLLATGGARGALVLWDLAARRQIARIPTDSSASVSSVAFSPDRRTLAWASSDVGVRFWDVADGQQIGAALGPDTRVTSLAFSPDGRTLASGGGRIITVWDVASRQSIQPALGSHDGDILSLAFSSDGRLIASAGRDNTVRVWNAASGQNAGQFKGHTGAIRSVAFSPDGAVLASGSEDGTIGLWDVAQGTSLGPPLTDHTDQVRGLAFSPDGSKLASGSRDSTVIVWDVARWRPIGEPLSGHTRGIWSVAFSPDGSTLASASDDETVILWDVATPKVLLGHGASVNTVAFSRDGTRLASGSEDAAIRLWDVATGKPVGRPLTGHASGVLSVAFSPSGGLLASGGRDRTVRLWDPATGLETRRLDGHAAAVKSVAFSPDGKVLASGGRDDRIILWDVEGGQQLEPPLEAYDDPLFSIAFSRDGTRLVAGSRDGKVILWDVNTGKRIEAALEGHADAVNGVAFSPDGRLVASGSGDGGLILWDTGADPVTSRPLGDRRSGIESVAFSPDSTMLASGGADKAITLWDVASGAALGQALAGHADWVTSVAFAVDGKRLASGSRDATIRLWTVGFESLPRRACALVARDLNEEEWRRYVGSEPYRRTCADVG